MEVLSASDIAARIAALQPSQPTTRLHTMRSIGENLVDALRVEGGIGLGLAQIDVLTRGFRPTDLVLVTGFAASAKTQVTLTMILNSPNKRVLFFSLDDPAPLILAKLVAMKTGIPAETLERHVREGDDDAVKMILDTAESAFPNLIIVDDVMPISDMRGVTQEATDLWGEQPDAVVLDYVEMIPAEGDGKIDQYTGVKAKLNALKGWAKEAPYPLIAIHQGTRSNSDPGAPITLLSLGYSGEQQATIVLGVRRIEGYENTVTLHLVKNKRPGGRLTHPQGINFHLEPSTGLIEAQTAAAVTERASKARGEAQLGSWQSDAAKKYS